MSTPRCNTCKVVFQTREDLTKHYRSDLHRQNLILVSQHDAILTAVEYQSKLDEAFARHLEEEGENETPVRAPSSPAVPEPLTHLDCLFCTQKFDDPDLAFAHMQSHGFYFVYAPRLKDRTSLMSFFRTKVGNDFSCIFCSKRFKSLKAVRCHMRGTGHCTYDIDEDTDPFYEPEQELAFAHFTEDATGELHTETGKVFGHRKYKHYYSQTVPDAAEMQKGMRKAIAGPRMPRESLTAAEDRQTRREELLRQQNARRKDAKKTTKSYHANSDMHRGNA
jgi:hypothetical protein